MASKTKSAKTKTKTKNLPTVTFRDVKWVAVSKVLPNAYNPNRMSPTKYAAFCEFVDKVGFIGAIAVSPPDAQGIHTIIDGEHRHRYLKERGTTKIPVVVMPKNYNGRNHESMIASLQFNIHGENDGLMLSEVYQHQLDNGYTPESLAAALGESAVDVARVAAVLSEGYNANPTEDYSEDEDEDSDDESDSFVTIELCLPADVWDRIVEPEIRRIMRVAGIKHKSDERIEFGQALELMAVTSAQTPEESLS